MSRAFSGLWNIGYGIKFFADEDSVRGITWKNTTYVHLIWILGGSSGSKEMMDYSVCHFRTQVKVSVERKN
jgi:hypothetical protein